MKSLYGVILLAFIATAALMPAQQVKAQDTLAVEWETAPGSGEPLHNALHDAIVNDASRPAGRVYLLRKGGYYWQEDRVENPDFHLRIVGEPAGTTGDENPPVLQMVQRADNSIDQRMITVGNDLTLKNLWITGADNTSAQSAYQPIQVDGSGHTIVVDNCVIDRSNFSIIAFQGGANNKVFVTNNKFRNLIGRPADQQWQGRGVSVWADQDSVVVENNTFFNVGFTAFQMESGAIRYLRFVHNTLVNIGRNFLTGAWWREAYFANNLIVNGFWHGEGGADYTSSGRDPRAYNSGMMAIGPLPSKYGPEQGRRILLANTASWRDPLFTTYYADTIRAQYFVNRVTIEDFLDSYPTNMKAMDTTWLATRPNFPVYPDTLIPKMWDHIISLRRGITPAPEYFYELPSDISGECYVCVSWPLPEDFSYTQPVELLTAGTDGLPLGDLNWFPTEKATWLANYDQFVQEIEDKAGPRVKYFVDETHQAENGTIGGPSERDTVQGFTYFQMDGGGNLEWVFDLPTAGQYDLKIWTHLRGNNQRGQHTFINGVEIHDAAHGWGELIYDIASGPANGLPNNEWIWVPVTQADINEAGALTLPAGQNIIRMTSSWGYQNFAGIDLLPAGTTTPAVQLRASDVTSYEVVAPRADGYPYVPEYFKSVLLNTSGTITWTVTPDLPGDYAIQMFYQNYGSPQTVQFTLDGSPLPVTLASNTDSTGLSVLSDVWTSVTAAAHSLVLTGSDVNIDYIQLVRKEIVSSVGDNEVPLGYDLAQNYPNPFNPATEIQFALGKASHVTLTVFNLLGQKVTTLVDGPLSAGQHSVRFNASNLSTGVYFYRLEAGTFKANKKMLLLK